LTSSRAGTKFVLSPRWARDGKVIMAKDQVMTFYCEDGETRHTIAVSGMAHEDDYVAYVTTQNIQDDYPPVPADFMTVADALDEFALRVRRSGGVTFYQDDKTVTR
jgi:hypothetical protein